MHDRIATLILASFVCVSAARAQAPTYDVVFLGAASGAPTTTYPMGVNDHGVVVGNATLGPFAYAPFVASVGTAPALLPLLPGYTTGTATAINNAGVIVGSCGPFQGNEIAVIWTPSPSGYTVASIPPLPTTGKSPATALALNELGDVVGIAHPPAKGFVWTAGGGTVDVATLGLDGLVGDVNERRRIVAGLKRMDLDTLVVDAIPVSFSGNLRELNDAGIATWGEVKPGANAKCGSWEFGVGPTSYGSKSFLALTGGIDYATTVPYEDAQPTFTEWLHVEGIGDFAMESCFDPGSPGWKPGIALGCGVSANGLIVIFASNATLGLAGPILLTPQRFHAILEGAPGIEGLPVLAGEGSLQSNSPVTFRLSHANPSSPVGVIAGLSRVDLPFYGGLLVPAPTLVLTGLSTDASGKLTLATTWPAGLPSGTKVYVQEWVADANAPFGIAGSNALECVTP